MEGCFDHRSGGGQELRPSAKDTAFYGHRPRATRCKCSDQMVVHMSEPSSEREHVKLRVRYLLDACSTGTLLDVEALIQERLEREEPPRSTNPSGDSTRGRPCSKCGAPSPPAEGAPPWPTRPGPGDEQVPKGGVCTPCLRANKRQRTEWKPPERRQLGKDVDYSSTVVLL